MTSVAPSSDSMPSRIDRSDLDAFIGAGADSYAMRLEMVARGGRGSVHWHAAGIGPLWAAWRRCWILFWPSLAVDTAALALVASAIGTPVDEGRDGASSLLLIALVLLVVGRMALGRFAYLGLWKLYLRWRQGDGHDCAPSMASLMAGLVALLGFAGVAVLHFGQVAWVGFLAEFPTDPQIQRSVAGGIDRVVDWMTIQFDAVFGAITIAVRELLNLLEAIFIGLPWPIVCGVTILLAWRLGGWKVALFAAVSLFYLGIFNYWEKSMSTLSLVGASAFFCIVAGAPLGILCGKRPRLYNAIRPVLDIMQVMPTFVYLIPAVAFFSIGKPPGVLATVIFAMPPMVRLTALGIQQVPESVREAGTAFGAGPWQLLAKIELPLAIPSIMTGVNQTIMMCLSMVIVASMIGAGGLGYDVLVALRHLKTGEGFLAGMAIVVCAMMLDRIIQGGGKSRQRVRR